MKGRSPRRPLGLLIAMPLLLGGCLLPQPDTPPIPPGAPMSQGKASAPQKAGAATTAPSAGTISNNAGGLNEDASRAAASEAPMPAATSAPSADQGFTSGASGTAAMAPASPGTAPGGEPPGVTVTKATPPPGRLAVTFTGDDVSDVWLEPVGGGGTGAGMPVVGDMFTVDLPAGEYYLELTVAGQRLRTTKPIAVPAGGDRTLAVTVEGGAITIEESVPLADPEASPSPTPSASPSAGA